MFILRARKSVKKNDMITDFFFLFFLFRAKPRGNMEVPRLGVQLEPQPLAYAKATATSDPSCL